MLLTIEQTNQLLLKNHDLRSIGAKVIFKANANENRNTNRFRGYGRGSRCSSQRGSDRPTHDNSKPQYRNAFSLNQNKANKLMQKLDNVCTRCGLNGHWAHVCHTPKYFVEFYQASIKGKCKRVESHFVDNAEDNIEVNNALVLHTTPISEVPLTSMEVKSLEISNFIDNQNDKAENTE